MELVTLGVVLGAYPGPTWRYRDASGETHAGSQGLTLAIVRSFLAGGFSADARQPLRVDAQVLAALSPARLGAALQVTADNPMVGMEGRVGLLARLAQVSQRSALFDRLRGRAHGSAVHVAAVLAEIVAAFASIWPASLSLAGQNLGDVWTLTLLAPPPAHLSERLVPLHMLSQWLAYSLVEPLESAGLQVTGLGELTGLAEVRSGGLFVDGGVLVPRDPATLIRSHKIDDELIVEWRACTVALLERLAPLVRARLGVDEHALPVARLMLGTFRAGRALAAERRAGGAAPITLDSDGAVL